MYLKDFYLGSQLPCKQSWSFNLRPSDFSVCPTPSPYGTSRSNDDTIGHSAPQAGRGWTRAWWLCSVKGAICCRMWVNKKNWISHCHWVYHRVTSFQWFWIKIWAMFWISSFCYINIVILGVLWWRRGGAQPTYWGLDPCGGGRRFDFRPGDVCCTSSPSLIAVFPFRWRPTNLLKNVVCFFLKCEQYHVFTVFLEHVHLKLFLTCILYY